MNKGQLFFEWASAVAQSAQGDINVVIETVATHYKQGTLELELKHFAEQQAVLAQNNIASAENNKQTLVERETQKLQAFEAIKTELEAAEK